MKKNIFLALILVLFSVVTGFTAVRYLLDTGDIVRFDLITRYGVSSMAGEGLDGDDTSLWLDMSAIDTGVQTITGGDFITNTGDDDNPILNVDVDDSITANTALWTSEQIASEIVALDSGVQLITGTHPIIITGTTQPDISFADTYTYTQAEIDAKVGGDTGVWDITAGTNLTNSGTAHQPILDVDDVFYTKTAADLLLLDKADTPHDHNNLYYTESEADALLLDKADTPHAHDDRYYTESESDALLLDKADTPHAHDDRYYTETEEDTWRNSTTQTEMGYLHGVSSDIQDQLDAGGGGVQTVTAGNNMTNSGTEADPVLDVYLETEVPLTPVTAGTTGDMKTDSNYLYVCISTNVWKRAELSSWITTPISIITNDGYYLTNSDGYSLITY